MGIDRTPTKSERKEEKAKASNSQENKASTSEPHIDSNKTGKSLTVKFTTMSNPSVETEMDLLTVLTEEQLTVEVKQLIKTRSVQRQRTTKAVNGLQSLFEEDTEQEGESLVHKIRAKLGIMVSVRGKLLELDEEIQALLDCDKCLQDTEESDRRQEIILEQMDRANTYLEGENKSKSSGKKSDHSSSGTTVRSPRMYKLPQLKLPYFSGDVLEFQTFYEQFLASVHDDPSIPKISKLQLLLGQLKGGALQMVKGYKIEASAYDNVWESLLKEYNHPPKIVESHILKLLNLQAPKFNYTELYNFKGEIECHVRSLKTLEITNDHVGYSIVFSTILAQKLPQELKSRINWEKLNTHWTLELLQNSISNAMTVLASEGQSLETIESSNKKSKTIKQNNNFNSNRINRPSPSSQNRLGTVNTYSAYAEGNVQPPQHQSKVNNNILQKSQTQQNNFRIHPQQNFPSVSQQPQNNPRQLNPQQKFQTVNRQNTNRFTQRVLRCRLCLSQGHLANDCNSFPNLESRKQCIAERQLCLNCLTEGHTIQSCYSLMACKFCYKVREHNSSICPILHRTNNSSNDVPNISSTDHSLSIVSAEQTPSTSNNNSGNNGQVNAGILTLQDQETHTALPIAELNLMFNNQQYLCVSLFDQGSQRTLISTRVVRQMNLRPFKTSYLAINGINVQGERKSYDIVRCMVLTADGSVTIDAVVVDLIPDNIYMPGLVETTKLLNSLKVPLAYSNPKSDLVTDIQLLVGSDNLSKFLNRNKVVYGINLMDSNVGNLIWGNLNAVSEAIPQSFSNVVTVLRMGLSSQVDITRYVDSTPIPKFTVEEDIEKLWSLDHIGIKQIELTNNDKTILQNFEENLIYNDNRYTVSLPWKESHPPLPDNYGVAKSRLYGTLRVLQRQPELLKCYDDIFKEQVAKNFIEEIQPFTFVHPEGKVHYIPHHFVKKQSETTPIRIVYDCSAGKPSLNDCLWTGPKLVPDLCKLLLRFRECEYALSADVEKAFLQLQLADRDKDSTRFLWFQNPFDPQSPLKIYRFKSVLFGSTSSPFLLNACIKYHIKTSNTPITEQLFDSFYVDNLLCTFSKEEEIIPFFEQANQLMSKAGLILREWTTNSVPAREHFKLKGLNTLENPIKILGMEWNVEQDTILYPFRTLDVTANTKRKVLSSIASIFDPLGYLAPVTIRAKILLQKLFKFKYQWDDVINSEFQSEWVSIVTHVNSSIKLTLPRQLIYDRDVILHVFSDASKVAYGTALYVVSGDKSYLLIAKPKVAPIKELTIPRLELTAALLSCRLVTYVLDAYKTTLNINQIICWTDSQVCLQWISSRKQLVSYVQNRVDEIHKLLPTAIWKYVPTKENPSDYISRGTSSKQLYSDLWLYGPTWITKPSFYPTWEYEGVFPEIEASIVTANVPLIREVSALFTIEDFGSLQKIYRISMLIVRYVNNIRAKLNKTILRTSTKSKVFSHNFSNEERSSIEKYWIKVIQSDSFLEEIYILQNERPPNARILSLHLFLDFGILRCNRRLDNALLPHSVKFPILLPNKHHFTKLLIMEVHELNFHTTTSHLSTIIRQQYYFIKMRQTLKSILRTCILCKRLQAVHFRSPPIAPLPSTRVTETRPFAVVGIDYTGYFYVRDSKTKVNKVYIALFTCAVTRALHLEVINDNSKDSFLNALHRFICRRSRPSIIYSDNGTYFVAAADYLKKLHLLPKVQEFLHRHHMTWRFNPSRASHFGGFFEAMIRLTKTCLKKSLKSTLVSREDFITVIAEVELCLNTRPLTYVDDKLEESEPLTPSHLLTGYNLNGMPVPVELLDEDEDYNSPFTLSKRYKYLLHTIEQFWQRWKKDYLTSLRQHAVKTGHPDLTLGDVVLIQDDVPRLKWKMGIVVQMHTGPDGYTRSVALKTSHGIVTRAVIHLYPLEIKTNLFPPADVPDSSVDSGQSSVTVRPMRQAAVVARERMQRMLVE